LLKTLNTYPPPSTNSKEQVTSPTKVGASKEKILKNNVYYAIFSFFSGDRSVQMKTRYFGKTPDFHVCENTGFLIHIKQERSFL